MSSPNGVIVLVSADAEWQAVREIFPEADIHRSPFGEWFTHDFGRETTIFQGGWGKISAAASTQYVIDRWHPNLLINLGTCGGFEGEVERGAIILVERTIIYDIIEQMDDDLPFIQFYQSVLDLSWLEEPYPHSIVKTLMISGDRDLVAEEIPVLKERYDAIAGDWESGAIAWVAERNGVHLLILRGVSDLVGGEGGEVYGDYDRYKQAARQIMRQLFDALPNWLDHAPL
jgi:adenosylhomocysteine nucleosidase